MSDIEQVFGDFIDAWNAGRRPRVGEHLRRVPAGPDRDELAGPAGRLARGRPRARPRRGDPRRDPRGARGRPRPRRPPTPRAGCGPRCCRRCARGRGCRSADVAAALVARFGLAPGRRAARRGLRGAPRARRPRAGGGVPPAAGRARASCSAPAPGRSPTPGASAARCAPPPPAACSSAPRARSTSAWPRTSRRSAARPWRRPRPPWTRSTGCSRAGPRADGRRVPPRLEAPQPQRVGDDARRSRAPSPAPAITGLSRPIAASGIAATL